MALDGARNFPAPFFLFANLLPAAGKEGQPPFAR
jgi:hypothetical protein